MYKPMLAPNQQPDLNELNYPLLASTKLDGIRCIFYKGQILSRSLKQIQNKQLREKFEPIRKFTEERNLILDGEIYGVRLTFQQITSFVMTQDFEDKKSIKKFGKIMKIPEELKFYCFDVVKDDYFEVPFRMRTVFVHKIEDTFKDIMVGVNQQTVNNSKEINEYFDTVIEQGYEGLILKSFDGKYKCGRGTLREGLIFKVKPFRTFDSVVKDVVQSTVVDPDAEKKTNELGRSVTSKKKDDRILIEKASAFVVEYEGKELKVVLAMTDEEKEEVWKNKETYIGRMIEYKGMLVGAKDVPRHPVMIRFREDK